jgi:hypothetical protein
MPISVALRRLARLACLTAVAAGCYWSVRLAWADHLFRRDTESTVALAVKLAPGNAEYHARLASLRQETGRGEAAIEPELRAAVQANPRMSSAWIELGLRAETAGEMAQAERDLVRAVQGGLFDEGYFMYWEDMDWCYRMRRAGWGVFVVPEARAIHVHRREGVRRPFSRAGRAQLIGAVRFFRKFGWNPGKVA